MNLNEISFDLLSIIRGGGMLSDDDELDIRYIKYWVKTQRALWIHNDLNKGRSVDTNIIQDLGCVAMETTDASTCCLLPSNCSVFRSVQDIPVTIQLNNSDLITHVGPVNMMIPTSFSYIPYQQALWSGNGRYNFNTTFAFLYNNKIYLKVPPENLLGNAITYINIRGVFEDPEEVRRFSTCNGQSCYTDNSKYPVNMWMIDYMKTAILNANIKILLTTPVDKTNNSNQDLQQNITI